MRQISLINLQKISDQTQLFRKIYESIERHDNLKLSHIINVSLRLLHLCISL